jgi:PPK2 family polyphosphate:nucleotide phosphotransferase
MDEGSRGAATEDEAGSGIPGVGARLAVPPGGTVDLASLDAGATPGFDGGKAAGKAALADLEDEVVDLQERLAADAYTGGRRSVLLVVQGMDTAGKGGVLKQVVGLLNPGGVRATAFKAPTEEERAHDFLWRIEKELPRPGQVGIFDRSHYEDVLVAKVHGLAPAEEIERRYGAINDFERRLTGSGTTLVKCMLHISAEEQRERLLARLDDPTKVWKFKPGDVDERRHWAAYQEAYAVALERCSTDEAPWHVVPSNRKWYRSLAIATLLRDALRRMELTWPEPDFDVEEQKRRLLES